MTALRWKKAEYSGLPVIKCLPYDNGLQFWCPFCKIWHHHGSGGGLQSARCLNLDLCGKGYVLTVMTKRELIEIKKDIDNYLKQPESKDDYPNE